LGPARRSSTGRSPAPSRKPAQNGPTIPIPADWLHFGDEPNVVSFTYRTTAGFIARKAVLTVCDELADVRVPQGMEVRDAPGRVAVGAHGTSSGFRLNSLGHGGSGKRLKTRDKP